MNKIALLKEAYGTWEAAKWAKNWKDKLPLLYKGKSPAQQGDLLSRVSNRFQRRYGEPFIEGADSQVSPWIQW